MTDDARSGKPAWTRVMADMLKHTVGKGAAEILLFLKGNKSAVLFQKTATSFHRRYTGPRSV